MTRLAQKLNLWEQNNLISATQKQQIVDFEKKHGKKIRLPQAIAFLGVFIFALGLISLIASNWQNIGDAVKLTADFVLLFALTAAVARADRKQQKTYFEIGLFALFWLTGASVGLIAQVLQTNGSLTDGLLLWTLFSLPLLALSGKKLLPLIWLPLFIYSLCFREAFWRFYTAVFDWIFTHLSSSAAVLGALIIAFHALLAATGGLLNVLSRRRFPVFAVWRGYAEALAYFAAFFLPVTDFSFATFAVGMVFFILAAALYYRFQQAKMLNFNIVMIGLSFLNAAFQLFGSLLATGLAFLAVGSVLLIGVFGGHHINKLLSGGKK